MLPLQSSETAFSHLTHTVFTWLNAVATISHLCKMTAATIRVRHLLQCNNDSRSYYSKPRSFTVQIILFVIYYSILRTWYPHRYVFLVNCAPSRLSSIYIV